MRYLVQKGYQNIVALKRPTSPMDLVKDIQDQVEWQECDILDLPYLDEIFRDIDVVFHCAAKVSFQPSERKTLYQVNVEGTSNVVNLCLFHKVKQLIHVSSTAAIGRTKEVKIISETSKWNRSDYNTHYAVSKYMAEQEVWRGMMEGLSIAIVNPSIILGSGLWNQGPQKLFKIANQNFPFYPIGRNGFVDVRDVVEFMVLLLENAVTGERFIINGENLYYRDLLTSMANYLDKKPPKYAVNKFMRLVTWRLEKVRALLLGKPPFITRETTMTSANDFQFDNTKSKEIFGFKYRSIDTTIRETCQQLQEAEKSNFQAMFLPFEEPAKSNLISKL